MKDRDVTVAPRGVLRGMREVPGDKSVSHRAALAGALSREGVEVEGFAPGADCASTLRCLEALGARVQRRGDRVRVARGEGPLGAAAVLDAGNSGTTARLLCGLLAGQPGTFTVIQGDESLSRRPMRRVVDPLRTLGARIDGREGGGLLPLSVRGTSLSGGVCTPGAPSAQVKSALLLAGLSARGSVTVAEPLKTRDHTEILLEHLGVPLRREGTAVTVYPLEDLPGGTWKVPGDFSSAAFWIVAAALLPEADLTLPEVGLNPTRTGLLSALGRMGLDYGVTDLTLSGGEPLGTLQVRSSSLEGTVVDAPEIPALVDELPILAVAAVRAKGVTEIRGARELRFKECDRIAAMAEGLRTLGAEVEEREDGWILRGPCRLRGGEVDSFGDHRVAMALGVAALTAEGPVRIRGAACAGISYPGFFEALSEDTAG